MNDKILSQNDLIEITGYRQVSKQIKVLRSRGIEPIKRPDNTISVLWQWIENINKPSDVTPYKPKLMPIK